MNEPVSSLPPQEFDQHRARSVSTHHSGDDVQLGIEPRPNASKMGGEYPKTCSGEHEKDHNEAALHVTCVSVV